MCFKPMSAYERRREFVRLAEQRSVTMKQRCARFETTTKTGYKWLSRCRAEGDVRLRDRSIQRDGARLRGLRRHPR